MEGKLGGRVLDLVQSKVGLSRLLGALEPLGLWRSPVTPGFSWKSLALLSSIFLHSYPFHTFPTAGLEYLGFLASSLVVQMVKNLPAMWETGFDPWVGKIPWRRKLQPTPVFLPREFHGQRSLVGYSTCGHKQLDMTEKLTLSLFIFIHFH